MMYDDASYTMLYLWGLGGKRGRHGEYPGARMGKGGLLRGEEVVVEF